MLLRSFIAIAVTSIALLNSDEAVAGRRVRVCPQNCCPQNCYPQNCFPQNCFPQNSCTPACEGSAACGNSSTSSAPSFAAPGSVSQEMANLNAAVTAAKIELAELQGQLVQLNKSLGNVDKKVTIGPDSDPAGVGKAVDERLPKKP